MWRAIMACFVAMFSVFSVRILSNPMSTTLCNQSSVSLRSATLDCSRPYLTYKKCFFAPKTRFLDSQDRESENRKLKKCFFLPLNSEVPMFSWPRGPLGPSVINYQRESLYMSKCSFDPRQTNTQTDKRIFFIWPSYSRGNMMSNDFLVIS